MARTRRLADVLVDVQAEAERVAQLLRREQSRIAAKVKVAAREPWTDQPDASRVGELAALVRQSSALEQESIRLHAKAQMFSEALAHAQVREEQLARALARARALTRAPKVGAIAVARFLWQLRHVREGLWHGLVRSLTLGMGVVALLVWMLPKADRARWRQESYSWLEELRQEGAPLLGTAGRIALRIPWLALVLWTPPTRRWLARLRPLWIGLGTAGGVFLAGLAGMGESPADDQVRLLVAGALLAGIVAASQAYKGRRSRGRNRKRW